MDSNSNISHNVLKMNSLLDKIGRFLILHFSIFYLFQI